MLFSPEKVQFHFVFAVISDEEPSCLCRTELAFHLWGAKVGHSGDKCHLNC